jgi:hypothetical protein
MTPREREERGKAQRGMRDRYLNHDASPTEKQTPGKAPVCPECQGRLSFRTTREGNVEEWCERCHSERRSA